MPQIITQPQLNNQPNGAISQRPDPVTVFSQLNRSDKYGWIDTESKEVCFHSLHAAERFWQIFPEFELSYIWPKRVVSFTVGSETGSAVVSRVTPNGRKDRTYKLTEASFQRLRRFWRCVDAVDRNLVGTSVAMYDFVW